ncbi:MAG: hypothetical protein Kow0060_19120 [Methylohalobius crimeensis]
MPQTRSQNDARLALKQITEVADKNAKVQSRYGMLVNRLPLMVRENGFLAALAFLQAKGDKDDSAEKLLLRHLCGHFTEIEKAERMHRSVLEADLTKYRRLTRRMMEILVWYKRLAESKLGVDATGTREASHDSN